MITPCLSIRQPWAWAIIHAGKDIENRDWPTRYRGRILIHAGVSWYSGKRDALEDTAHWARDCGIAAPSLEQLERGGIVGEAEIVDCVTEWTSSWFFGPFGFVLRNAKPLPFRPLKGRLGFFNVEE